VLGYATSDIGEALCALLGRKGECRRPSRKWAAAKESRGVHAASIVDHPSLR
jgi:hypothetical protein